MRRAPEEGAEFEVILDIVGLPHVSPPSPASRAVGIPHIHVIQYGHYKDVEVGVSPTHDNSRAIRLPDVCRPEDSHKPIMLYHINRRSIERRVF